MEINSTFKIDYPFEAIWEFFENVPEVADCLTGSEYLGTDEETGKHRGAMQVKIGPFKAKFEGLAVVSYLKEDKNIILSGQGIDKRGGSRTKMMMDCSLVDMGDATEINIVSNLKLSGTVAQFGRAGIMQEIAKIMIDDFVANVQRKLGQEGDDDLENPSSANELSAGNLMWKVLKNKIT